jgi:hypothetical protein
MKNNTQPALKERIEKALEDFTKGRASMHVPPLDTDVDMVLAECNDRLSELEAKCAALAAEVYDLKHPGTYLPSKHETPDLDAFLAEVRAQGVEAAIATAKNVVAQEFQYEDFETAQRVCSKFPESDLVGKVEMVEWLEDFAAQLRKGVHS